MGIVNGNTTKGADETLNYTLNWANVLGSDAITGSSFVAESGLTVEDSSFEDSKTIVSLSGGTLGTTYNVTNTITTNTQTAVRILKVLIV